ncbi:hypothetical protein KFL_000350210 [Klebsormidium nitens]|uniref:Uncharacterized protein n=1 Tax=Klebsormidium nitens TaxID=105231 RepID=A0A1Y1HSX6_KLENI|nr:hypothetical protein KFL_000350210 [Klebsormidium nitens]|eukprot:GAQ79666.1 hypothetical protein KFL_000350210 [Klebsormidium nitens]
MQTSMCGASGGRPEPQPAGGPDTALNKDQELLQNKRHHEFPPFSALQLIVSGYLQESPSAFFNQCRLVNKTFRSAINAAHPPYTWHLQGACLNSELQTVLQCMSAEQGFWKGVKNVRLNGSDVSMTEGDCQLLVAALGARAWESVSLVEVNLTHPAVMKKILHTSAERGTLRHLSISDSPVSERGLQRSLASVSHCLETLQILHGVTFYGQGASKVECPNLRTLVLASPNGTRETFLGWLLYDITPPPRGRVPLSFFRCSALRTLWLVGLGTFFEMTEADVIGIFERVPLLEEFRLFNGGLSMEFPNDQYFSNGSVQGSDTRLTSAVIAGVFKGLTRHCPRLKRISIGQKSSPCTVRNGNLDGSWLRRFADAHPKLTEVNLFITGRFATEAWLYAIAKWAPTLEKFTGHFKKRPGDFESERQLVLLAKAPELTELECLGGNYREEIEWMRRQSPKAFQKLKTSTYDKGKLDYKRYLHRPETDRGDPSPYWNGGIY